MDGLIPVKGGKKNRRGKVPPRLRSKRRRMIGCAGVAKTSCLAQTYNSSIPSANQSGGRSERASGNDQPLGVEAGNIRG